jgi:hypothetical protein
MNPSYKETPWRRVGHTWIKGAPWNSSPLLSPHAPPLSSLSLSLSLVLLPEGMHRSEGNSNAARQSDVGILDQIQTDLLPQSRLDPRSRRSHRSLYVYEYYEVLNVLH